MQICQSTTFTVPSERHDEPYSSQKLVANLLVLMVVCPFAALGLAVYFIYENSESKLYLFEGGVRGVD